MEVVLAPLSFVEKETEGEDLPLIPQLLSGELRRQMFQYWNSTHTAVKYDSGVRQAWV